jgi:hypothetical protein
MNRVGDAVAIMLLPYCERYSKVEVQLSLHLLQNDEKGDTTSRGMVLAWKYAKGRSNAGNKHV